MPPFSYFRNQHRRSGSTPTSDSPHSPLWRTSHSAFGTTGDDSAKSPASFRPSAIPSPAAESPVSPSPPVLPPIRRVASKQEKERSAHVAPKSDSGPPMDRADVDPPRDGTSAEPSKTTTAPILPPIPRIMTRRQPGHEPLKISTSDTKPEIGYRRSDQAIVQGLRAETAQSNQQDTRWSSRISEGRQAHSSSPLFDPPPFGQQSGPRPSTPPYAPSSSELQPPANSNSRRASSPASSFSSFQKSISSSNLALESSPGSKAVQPSIPTAQRSAKPKMNLLNPMSLLRRRRTAQNVEILPENTIVTHHNLDVPAMSLPEDYDPRIKGPGVHDFSAPRPRRHHSTNDVDTSNLQSPPDMLPEEKRRPKSTLPPPSTTTDKPVSKESSTKKTPEAEHIPIFHENFDTDMDEEASSSAVNRESLANPSFLARMSQRLDFESPQQTSPPTESASDVQQRTQSPAGERTSKSTVGALSVRASSDHSTARSSMSNDTRATSPPGSPPSKTKRTSVNLEPPFQATSLKHLSSNASRTSRFSFQLNSEATQAQEKELEDKGKEKAAKAKHFDSDTEGEFGSSSEDDVTNYGDMDDAPYEEDIPMVNVVDDDQLAEESGSESDRTNVRGTVGSKEILESQTDTCEDFDNPSNVKKSIYSEQGKLQHSEESIDSMYFDDGLIGDASPDASGKFDESLLDSPIESFGYDTQHIPNCGSGLSHAMGKETLDGDSYETGLFPDNYNQADEVPQATSAGAFGITMPNSSLPSHGGFVHPRGLEAYHNALASAATKAEADGRFRRKPSVDVSVSDLGSEGVFNFSDMSAFEAGPSDSNYDFDELDDDQMVAAANAEVLASEDSEYYGREFGFYGMSSNSDAEMYNGGFFGAAPDDLMRNASGMNAGREPNLTPITERSEFSTRNSFISLHAYGSNPSAPNSAIGRNDMSLPSPGLGLKELAASMNLDEDDMTLTQLIKLRRETFGMSGGSGFGSPPNSIPNGSPLAGPSVMPVETVEEEEQDWLSNESPSDGNDEFNDTVRDIEQPEISSAFSSMSPALGVSETTPKSFPPFNNRQSFGNEATSPAVTTPATAFSNSAHSPSSSIGHNTVSPASPFSTFGPSSAARSTPTSPIPMPVPSMMQKFASRPPASSASYAERARERNSMGSVQSREGGDSVAYIQEDDKWYLERRRRQSNGEMVVIGRELVEGGRI